MRRLITILTIPLLLAGCAGGEDAPRSGTTVVRFGFSGAAFPQTRGVASPGEDAIGSIAVFFYQDGQLVPELCLEGDADGAASFSAEFRLKIGMMLDVVALANVPFPQPPSTLDEALALQYTCNGPGDWAGGLPMAGHQRFKVRYSEPEVTVGLERLVAKLCLAVDTSRLEHGSIEFTSVAVRQMNARCSYFDESAASAGGVTDGDCATELEIGRLNAAGNTVYIPFYMLENMQGDLLPDNSEPDLKTPESVLAKDGDPGLCTYVEVTGNYRDRSGHLVGQPLYARFFPGSDACRNFDIERNNVYLVTMCVTDNGCLRADWKLDGNIQDSRTLNFLSSGVNLDQGDGTFLRLNTNLSYAQGDYSYKVTGASSEFNVFFQEGGVSVNAKDNARVGAVLTVSATTWDGGLATSCKVTATRSWASLFEVTCSGDLYVAQRGWVTVKSKTGADLTGRTSLNPVGPGLKTHGAGEDWYYDAYEFGYESMYVTVDGVTVASLSVEVLAPDFEWSSDPVIVPLDGSYVVAGPFLVDKNGNRMTYDDFNPEIINERLKYTLSRSFPPTLWGRFWKGGDGSGNPQVEMTDIGCGYPCYAFRLKGTTWGGYDIHDNYDFSNAPVRIEKITAKGDVSMAGLGRSSVYLCVEDD